MRLHAAAVRESIELRSTPAHAKGLYDSCAFPGVAFGGRAENIASQFIGMVAAVPAMSHGNSIPCGTNREHTTNPTHAPKMKQVIRIAAIIA
jgi:hypothetical protein